MAAWCRDRCRRRLLPGWQGWATVTQSRRWLAGRVGRPTGTAHEQRQRPGDGYRHRADAAGKRRYGEYPTSTLCPTQFFSTDSIITQLLTVKGA